MERTFRIFKFDALLLHAMFPYCRTLARTFARPKTALHRFRPSHLKTSLD